MTAEQRPCPVCGTDFTWTPAAPRQKYCSKRCKHRWHTIHRKPRDRRRRGGPATTAARPPAGDDHRSVPAPASGQLTAAPACPHCRQPVALVASITTPPPHITATRRDGP